MTLCHMVGLYKMTVKFKLLRNDSDDSEITLSKDIDDSNDYLASFLLSAYYEFVSMYHYTFQSSLQFISSFELLVSLKVTQFF